MIPLLNPLSGRGGSNDIEEEEQTVKRKSTDPD